jgi:monoamine oxidase
VVLPEIEALWPGSTAACLLDTVLPMIWAAAPAAKGSYTCYRPGQWATWGLEGERHANLHFCGEHCSLDFQGWMEGAAETGALVAAALLEEYGLQPSAGLDCILAAKLVVEQPAFGRLTERPRFRPRRERLRAAAVEARARLLGSPGSPGAPRGSARSPRR